MRLLLSPFARRSKAKRGDIEEGVEDSEEEKTETVCSSPALKGASTTFLRSRVTRADPRTPADLEKDASDAQLDVDSLPHLSQDSRPSSQTLA